MNYRLLLVTVASLSCAYSIHADDALTQQRVVTALALCPDIVIRERDGLPDSARLYRSGASDNTLAALRRVHSLRSVSVGDAGRVTDAGVTQLRGLKLEVLRLGPTQCGDDSLTAIGEMTSLRSLTVGQQVTDKGILRLTTLVDLESLGLQHSKISDDALRTVAVQFPRLSTLNLYSTAVSSRGIEHLRPLTQLRVLQAETPNVTGDVFRLLHAPIDDTLCGLASATLVNLDTLVLRKNITLDPQQARDLAKLLGVTNLDFKELQRLNRLEIPDKQSLDILHCCNDIARTMRRAGALVEFHERLFETGCDPDQ